jgi:hypothetical protein
LLLSLSIVGIISHHSSFFLLNYPPTMMFRFALIVIACLNLANAAIIDRSSHLRQLAGMTQQFPRNLQDDLDLNAVCDGFTPTDDDFLKGSACDCERAGATVTARCEKDLVCIRPEVGDKFLGDFSFEVGVDFGGTLGDLQMEEVVNALFEGNYATCFDYHELYDQQQVCVIDSDIFGDTPACTITIGGVACTNCEICDNDDTTLTKFDCTNIIEGEVLDQCTSASDLEGTVLGFLDLQATLADHCGAIAWASTVVGLVLASSLSVLMI